MLAKPRNVVAKKRPTRTRVISVSRDPEIMRRFFKYINQEGGCWLWTGRISTSGKGQFRIDWTRQKGAQGGTRMDTHRLAYIWFVGDIPEGGIIKQTCKVGACCNPDHLELYDKTKS